MLYASRLEIVTKISIKPRSLSQFKQVLLINILSMPIPNGRIAPRKVMNIRKAVIPAAGLGKRMLPVSKSVPKALLPILDKPMIQYAVEEAVEASVEQVIIITSPQQPSVESYFRSDNILERFLEKTDESHLLEGLNKLVKTVDIRFVNQDQPRGLGHAILSSRSLVGNEPFLVILPDDIIQGREGVSLQMIRIFDDLQTSIIAVKKVAWEDVHLYGVIQTQEKAIRINKIEGVVEKPHPKEAPSNISIVGRYILTPGIFPCIERTNAGAKGEIQLTDSVALLLEHEQVYAYSFEGMRYDVSTHVGLLRASLEIALQREATHRDVKEMIDQLHSTLLSNKLQ